MHIIKNNLSFLIKCTGIISLTVLIIFFFFTVSMIMFSTFEHSVDQIYRNIIQRRKEDCSRVQQLGVTCLAGYAAGAVGTVISNPADNIVSSLYNKQAGNVLQVITLDLVLYTVVKSK